jgi:hypothetical protein
MKPEYLKEIEEIAPTLSKLDKVQTHKVPYNYFDDLSDDIWKKMQNSPAVIEKHKNILQQLKEYFAAFTYNRIALSGSFALIMIIAGVWLFKTQNNSVKKGLFVGVQTTELHQYVTENIEEFPEELLAKRIETPSNSKLILENSIDLNDLDTYYKDAIESIEDDNI